MKKFLLLAALVCAGTSLFAHGRAGKPADSTKQFLLIVRYKVGLPSPSQEEMKTIGTHWGAFIGELTQSGKLVAGYRPGTEGKTISGNAKTTKEGAYGDKKAVSSIFVIKAGSIEEATEIAKKCPIYEMDGSVEVRAVINAMWCAAHK
jgi:hypothetical protein